MTASGSAPAADGLRSAAGRLDELGRRLSVVLDGVAASCGADVWDGPAADRFSSSVHDHRRRLMAVAADLVGQASRARQRAAHLDQLAAAPAAGVVTGVATGVVVGVVTAPPDVIDQRRSTWAR